MKINKFILTAIFGLILLVSCSENNSPIKPVGAVDSKANTAVARSDNSINTATLPQVILDYITANYPNATVVTSEIEDNGNYEVKLSTGVELIFSSTGAFIGIDNDSSGNDYGDSDILPSNLPQVILDYITTNHPNNTITEAELENNGNYEVQLNDRVVLVFDANGTFLGTGVDQDNVNDSNDNDNETNIDSATLPQIVHDYVTTNYPAQTIVEASVENNGHYEITLSNGIELYFDANGVFLNITGNGDDETNIDPSTLPQVVHDYITTNYPAQTIIQAEVESNGDYEVTLSNGVELFFDANGVFLRVGDGDDDDDGTGD